MSIWEIQYGNYANNTGEKADTLKEAVRYLQNQIEFGMEDIENEEERARYEAKIIAKLQSGKRLTAKELRYLRKNNPALYAQAIRIEAKRRGVEARLKSAQSKREVEEIQFEAISTISEKDPARVYMIAAVNEAVKEFKQTEEYRRLPQVDEKDEELVHGKLGYGVERKIEDTVEHEYSIKYEFEECSYQMAYADNELEGTTRFIAAT